MTKSKSETAEICGSAAVMPLKTYHRSEFGALVSSSERHEALTHAVSSIGLRGLHTCHGQSPIGLGKNTRKIQVHESYTL